MFAQSTENLSNDIFARNEYRDRLDSVGLREWFEAKEDCDRPSHQFSIYKVPENVRKFNSAAYEPRAILLGLYVKFNQFNQKDYFLKHKDKQDYYLKHIYGKKFIRRNKESFDIMALTDLLEEYRGRVNSCYQSLHVLFGNLVPNGIFIIEYLTRSCYPEFRGREEDEPSFQLKKIHINHDLLLLENQIPYFFLQVIFNHFYPSSSPNFNDLVMSFFQKYNVNGMVPDFTSVMHFTDLIRTFHEPKRQTYDPRYPDFEFTASATQLNASGVVFKKVSERCLLDIDFKNNCLELPHFQLNEDQESLYRNLMALELCHYPDNTFIIDYFVFMDTLINTADDISLLVEAGVLVNRIGDYRDAANTFNKFCAGITNYDVGKSYLVPVYAKLNEYYKTPKHTWITTFKRDYFGSPLRSASTITAVSLVVLTFISTVCSVISVM